MVDVISYFSRWLMAPSSSALITDVGRLWRPTFLRMSITCVMANGIMFKVWISFRKFGLGIKNKKTNVFFFPINTAIKAKNVVTLSVDNVFVEPGIGVAGVSSTDTNNPLFIGGHPNPSKPRGIKTQEQFVGCIRNLNINRNLLRFGSTQAIGSVTATTCPTI